MENGKELAPRSQVSMVLAFLDALASVDVVANGSGEAVAQLLMAQHTSRVQTVLLTNCDTAVNNPPKAMLPVIEQARTGRYAFL